MPEPKIIVHTRAEYLPEESDPSQDRYAFAYHIRIQNVGSAPAQLLARRWIIAEGTGRVREVRGDGVVGQQPRLEPGETFEYTSGAVLESPVGSMHGAYLMVDQHGQRFDAEIPEFALSMPRTLH